MLVFQFLAYEKASSGIKMLLFQLSLSPNKAVVKGWLFSCLWRTGMTKQQRSLRPGGAEGWRGRHPAHHKCHTRSLRCEPRRASGHQRGVGLPTARRATLVPTSLLKILVGSTGSALVRSTRSSMSSSVLMVIIRGVDVIKNSRSFLF